MKKLFAILFVFQSLTLFSYSQNLRTFYENGKYGYKKENTVVIPAKFDYASDFSDSFAAVQVSGKWGFIKTNGEFLVEPKYKKVEKFQNGFARFYEGKKFGIINSKGEQVINAVCDEAYVDESTCRLISNGKQAWVSIRSNKVACDFNYLEIRFGRYFVDCYTGSTHDLYTISGNLLASNCDKALLLDEYYSTPILDICKNGREFLVDTTGRMLTDGFYKIEFETASYHKPVTEDYGFYKMICCYLNAESDEMKLVRYDGYMYDGVYTNWNYMDNKVTVEKDGKTFQLNSEGELIEQDYRRVRNVFEVLLLTANSGEEYVAVESVNPDYPEKFTPDTLIVDTFTSIRELYVPNYDADYYDPEGWLNEDNSRFSLNSQGLVEVEGTGANKGKYALYNCWQRRLITSFDSEKKELRQDLCFGETVVYSNEQGWLGGVIGGKQLPCKYASIDVYDYYGFVFTDSLDNRTFYSSQTKKWANIPSEVDVVNSIRYSSAQENLVVDPETGEEYWISVEPRLYTQFLMLLSQEDEPKFGFIDANGTVVMPEFDSIVNDMNYVVQEYPEPLIMTWKNGKCGVYNLNYGLVIEPTFDSIPRFGYDDYTNNTYAKIPERKGYLSSKGKWFRGTNFEPETFKQNGLYGLKDYTPWSDTDTLEVILPPIYKRIRQNYDVVHQLEVTNIQGENAVLNLETLDTLIPFTKNKLIAQNGFYSNDQLCNYYEIQSKKKVGLYNVRTQHAIPPIYDEVRTVEEGKVDEGFVYIFKDDKVGLYSQDLQLLLECEYDGIQIQLITGYRYILAQKGNKVYAFNYMYGDKLIMPKELMAFDFIIEGIGYNRIDGSYQAFDLGSYKYLGETQTLGIMDEYFSESLQVYEMNGLLSLKDTQQNKTLISGLRMIEYVEGEYVVTFEKGHTYYQNLFNKKSKFAPYEW